VDETGADHGAHRYEALSEGMSEGDEELWALERNTWSLVQALYA
jgi:hypothetical protein